MSDLVLAVPYPELSPAEILENITEAEELLLTAQNEASMYGSWPEMAAMAEELEAVYKK